MIALIDYGAGNLTSVKKALAAIGADVRVPADPADLASANGVIVPGVGHFGATRALDGAWTEAILQRVGEGRPLFGICLGMQWLFEGSDEAPEVPGLGVLPGRVVRLEGNAEERLKIPHVGWNTLTAPSGPERSALQAVRGPTGSAPQEKGSALLETGLQGRILAGLAPGAHVYFTHSYAAPVTADCVAETRHADTFSAVVERGNVFGVQFHPEKSSETGLQIIRNFLEVTRGC